MTKLSPAPQAVLDAANLSFSQAGTTAQGIATALRAAADQVVPETKGPRNQLEYELGNWDARDNVRDQLLAIATELETQS